MHEHAEFILDRINHWNLKLREFQDACSHTDYVKVANSNTGNFCPSDDSYWHEVTCNRCGKRWIQDQREYHKQWKKNHPEKGME